MDDSITFGLNAAGRMISINEVESGLSCGLVCAGCKERLVAKKGPVIQHHFAHMSDHVCSGAYESALHKLAKQIISDRLGITLPSVEARVGLQHKVLKDKKWFAFDRVELEVWYDGIRPDVVGYHSDNPIAIEILVTHSCGPEKLTLIKNKELAAIEIDLSNISRNIEYDALCNAVLFQAPRSWLFNKKINSLYKLLRVAEKERQALQSTKLEHAHQLLHMSRFYNEALIIDQQITEDRLLQERQNQRKEYLKVQKLIEAPSLEKEKKDLREAAVRLFGEEDGQQWMKERINIYIDHGDYTIYEDQEHRYTYICAEKIEWLCQVDRFWRKLHDDETTRYYNSVSENAFKEKKAAAKQADRDRQQYNNIERIMPLIEKHFKSFEKAKLWLNSKHPKLKNRSPRECCSEPNGWDICVSLLNSSK